MNCSEIFNKIDSLTQKYISVWEAACNIESPTDFKAGVDECGSYLAGIAKEFGCDVEIFSKRPQATSTASPLTRAPQTSP